ncbi:GNAT family N-acetyltransferase [Nocardia sp. NPDC127579]|uniref:GNAT family N-acetyltransferase n=1 Tax=Nocardia sp. NPDC127579 TaxID=3345402 RepID=UPI0036426889
MELRIAVDPLDGPEIADLLTGHLAEMHAHSPEDSVHALDLDELRKPEITCWSGRIGAGLVGCVALKELDPTHGEIKSMRTATGYTGRGIAAALLTHLLDVARTRGYERVSLETGTAEFFAPAVRLYRRHGFDFCGPFAGYISDPHSVFLTLRL